MSENDSSDSTRKTPEAITGDPEWTAKFNQGLSDLWDELAGDAAAERFRYLMENGEDQPGR
jgi:hypothetical protein